MPQIITNGSFDPANLQVDDLYIQIIPPPAAPTGTPVDIVAVAGTAPWGALNSPQLLGSPQDGTRNFGGITAASVTDAHDLPTEIVQLFAQAPSQAQLSVWATRVSDGTDAQASAQILDNVTPTPAIGGTAFALYSGSAANVMQMIVNPSTIANAFDVTIANFPGVPGELFPRISTAGTGGFWQNLANALANGISGIRPPSAFARFAPGTPTTQTAEALTLTPTPNGTATQFTGTLAHYPVLPGTVRITDSGGKTFNDYQGNGNLSGTGGTGTIVYATGQYELTYTTAPSAAGNATATATIGGTINNADTVALTFTNSGVVPLPRTVTYTVQTGDTLNGIAAGLAALINTDPGLQAANITAVAVGPVITVTQPGIIGNTTVITKTVVGSSDETVTFAPSNGHMGGATAITEAANYKSLAVDANPPAPGTYFFENGTDGRSVTTAMLIGNDESLPKTGLYALRALTPTPGLGYIAGMSDTTIIADLQDFGDSEGVAMAWAFPTGTSSQAAVTIKQNSGVDDWEMLWLKDWIYFYDSVNNQVRLIPPYSTILGRTATLSPQVSPGNKNVYGIVGTERNSRFSGNIPYSQAEIGLLESNGILFVTNPIPAGPIFGIRHGQNGYPVPPQDDVAYTRMTNYIAHSLSGFMGQFVDQPQGQSPNDPTRNAVKAVLNSFFQELQNLGQIDTQDVNGGPGFLVVCDLTNNPPSSIAARYLFAACRVVYMSNVRFFIISLQGGTTVVTQGNSQASALAGQQLAA